MDTKYTGNKTIILPIKEPDYELFMTDQAVARSMIGQYYKCCPELFPSGMSSGWALNGKDRASKKSGHRLRRLLVGESVYRIRPSFLLPYHRAKTDDVWRGLFLLRFGVPFWALALVFGRYAMWWYRLFISLAGNSIVGTTIRDAKYLLADEHHIGQVGKKAYVATTVGGGCFLGMSASMGAGIENLTSAYAR